MVRSFSRIALALVAASCALAVLAPPVSAAEGRIPLWTQVALAPGSTPGKYIVTRDIAAVPGSGTPAISISGGPGFEEVDIDLNGFTIYGDPLGGPAVISAVSLNSLTIRNGSVRQFTPAGNGIEVIATAKAVIEDVKTTDSGILLSDVPSFALRRNVVDGTAAGSAGIAVFGPPPFPGALSASGVIEGNQIYGAAGDGITASNMLSSITIRNNQVENPGGSGIFVAAPPFLGLIVGSLIVAENTVQDAGVIGILIREMRKGKVYNNTVYASGGDGIALAGATTGFLVLDNVSGGNGGSGMVVGGTQNHIDRNVLTGNLLAGLWFSPGSADNTFGRNTARGNGGFPGPCAFAPVTVCNAPFGPAGTVPPNFCNDGPGNASHCDNLMPGPPQG